MPRIAVIGTTSWGRTLATMLACNGADVRLWARTEAEGRRVEGEGPNPSVLPGEPFPASLLVTTSMQEALKGADAVILAVPSQTMRGNIHLAAPYIEPSTLIMSAAKGLEAKSLKRMSEVIAEEVPSTHRRHICVLSGPNLSREILQNLPAATVVAAAEESVAERAQEILNTPSFCVYTNTDVLGVELGGVLKNIIAIGAGMVEGLGLGDNARAAFITRSIIEMTALGLALGANPLTLVGLSGLGDAIATCVSPLSRNHHVGMEIIKGRPLKDITASMSGVAEGVNTTVAVREMACKRGIEMPVTEMIYRVLFEGADPRKAVLGSLAASAGHELNGRAWGLTSFSQKHGRR